ncbi:imidazole glycerol phosphate synthase subunit HisH [Acidihalobacter ferrooxydans]|uniref:Imidazole glycerol phosphate synthase subunit HisH n=1 Tax=Acidihalobacter ferrooxydans TaxID=1765967 RepID=A0A1P8UIG5_9GAMM|nr:imidazole glycerol phosphate synthase subunit HisH [Acidihalobacter ferrooxydans]APZ43626.1 imidazole glycerol phosphate synthase subunit HisH [Acidihalobacter ferrooxydans]
MSDLAIIDYAMGNLRSVANALRHVAPAGDRVIVTSDPEAVLAADRVVFPGQGAARDCMHELRTHGLEDAVREAARTKPFLGVCMGMQVLLDQSEENGGIPCLGIYPGAVRYFGATPHDPHTGARLKVPHMGWNGVEQTRAHPLWDGIDSGARFYFVHSYYVAPEADALVAGVTDYAVRYCSALARDNVFAIQCHPEKSAAAGLRLLANFMRWDGQA